MINKSDMEEKRECVFCEMPFTGRSDKRFCSHYCRTAHHNKRNHEQEKIFRDIESQLKKNRSILKRLNPAEENIVTKKQLEESGFNFKYITHYIKTEKSKVIMFCFEYGYQDMKKDGKYHLIRLENVAEAPSM